MLVNTLKFVVIFMLLFPIITANAVSLDNGIAAGNVDVIKEFKNSNKSIALVHSHNGRTANGVNQRDFLFGQVLLQGLSEYYKADIFNPIPQMLSSQNIISWITEKRMDMGIINPELYGYLDSERLLEDYIPIYTWASERYSVIFKGSGCSSTLKLKNMVDVYLPELLSGGGNILAELNNKYRLNVYRPAIRNITDPTIRMNEFIKSPSDSILVIEKYYAKEIIKEAKSKVCLLDHSINTEVNNFFVIHKRLLPILQGNKVFFDNINKIKREISRYNELEDIKSSGFLEGTNEAKLINDKIRKIKEFKEANKIQYNWERDSNYIRNELGTTNDNSKYLNSIVFNGTASYFFFVHQLFANIYRDIVKPNKEEDFIFSGVSGGAVSAFLLSLDSGIEDIPAGSFSDLITMSEIIKPVLTSQVITLFQKNIIVWFVLFAVSLLIQIIWFMQSPISLLKASFQYLVYLSVLVILLRLVGRLSLGLLFSFFILSVFMTYAVFLIGLVKRYKADNQDWISLKYLSTFFSFCCFGMLFHFPFSSQGIFDRVEYSSVFDVIARAVPHQGSPIKKCIGKNREEISACLYNLVKIPVIITVNSSNINRGLIKFYIKPKGSKLRFPKSQSWVNLADCPEKIFDVLETSSTLPYFFKLRSFTCGDEVITGYDGSITNQFPIQPAIEVGARRHIFELSGIVAQSLYSSSSVYKSKEEDKVYIFENLFDLFLKSQMYLNETATTSQMSNYKNQEFFFTTLDRSEIPFSFTNFSGTLDGISEWKKPTDLAKLTQKQYTSGDLHFYHMDGTGASDDYFYEKNKLRIINWQRKAGINFDFYY